MTIEIDAAELKEKLIDYENDTFLELLMQCDIPTTLRAPAGSFGVLLCTNKHKIEEKEIIINNVFLLFTGEWKTQIKVYAPSTEYLINKLNSAIQLKSFW